MIGAKMIASGAMGDMTRSVWLEGSIIGTGNLAGNILQNAIRSMIDNVTINVTVEGVGPTQIILTPSSSPLDAAAEFGRLRIRDNVLGMIANALRSHAMCGGGGTLDIIIDL